MPPRFWNRRCSSARRNRIRGERNRYLPYLAEQAWWNFYLDEGGYNYRRRWNENFTFSIPTGRLRHQVKAGADVSFKYYDPAFGSGLLHSIETMEACCEKAATMVETFDPIRIGRWDSSFKIRFSCGLISARLTDFAWIRTGRHMSTVSLRESAQHGTREHRIGHVSAAASVTSMIVFCFRH